MNLSDLDSCDINKLVIVSGTVIRTSSRKVLQKSKQFKCSLCGCAYELKAEHENYGIFMTNTLKCSNIVAAEKKDNPFFSMIKEFKKGKTNNNNSSFTDDLEDDGEAAESRKVGVGNKKMVQKKCCGMKFDALDATATCIDYQEIRI